MLRQSTKKRTHKNNILLAAFTATAAGMTNVAGAMACFSFTANVTGHVASFAQHLVKNSWFELFIALFWLFMFFLGAFAANFLIRSFEHLGAYKAHSVPIYLEIILMIAIAIYGISQVNETEVYTQLLAAALLFSMGLQNSTVSTITGGSVKTSHLTGLFTDLGAELSEWLHPKITNSQTLENKLKLRLTILSFYLFGGLIGGFLFIELNFIVFFIIAFVLLIILYYDIIKIITIKKFRNPVTKNFN